MDAGFWNLDRKITHNFFQKLQCCTYLRSSCLRSAIEAVGYIADLRQLLRGACGLRHNALGQLLFSYSLSFKVIFNTWLYQKSDKPLCILFQVDLICFASAFQISSKSMFLFQKRAFRIIVRNCTLHSIPSQTNPVSHTITTTINSS